MSDTDINSQLQEAKGIICRQRAQKGEAIAESLGIPFESKNEYALSLLPVDKIVANDPYDPKRWKPTSEQLESLDKLIFAIEESTFWNRLWTACCGCKNLRKLQMHFAVNKESGDVYLIERDMKLGGCCGCPLEMNLYGMDGKNKVRIGRVKENFTPYCGTCFANFCTCTYYHDVDKFVDNSSAVVGNDHPDDSFEKAYTIRTNICCCGRVNNFCGATPCKNDLVIDILDKDGNEIVAHLQKTYAPSEAGGSCAALCRCCFEYSNYILEFPIDSDARDRMLLITAMIQVEYHLFERSGNE